MSEWNTNCWSSATRSFFWWSVSHGCNARCDERLEEFCRAKRPRRWTQIISEWILLRILNLTINVNKLNPMRAGRHIEVANSDEMSGD